MLYSRVEGEGIPLIIVHGFMGMSDNWRSFSSQFSELGYQVHALDMRNHGKSFHTEEFSYEIMAKDVFEYIVENQLEKIVLLGHSMGGKIAMYLAAKYSDLIDKLIVVDIGPKYYAPHHQTILTALNAVDFSSKPTRAQVEETIQNYISDFGIRQFLLKNLFWKEPGQLAFRFNLNVFNKKIENIGEALPINFNFNKPVLFIRGGNSDYILDSDFETIFYHFEHAIIETVPNAGHWVHAENPIDFTKKVTDFLKR